VTMLPCAPRSARLFTSDRYSVPATIDPVLNVVFAAGHLSVTDPGIGKYRIVNLERPFGRPPPRLFAVLVRWWANLPARETGAGRRSTSACRSPRRPQQASRREPTFVRSSKNPSRLPNDARDQFLARDIRRRSGVSGARHDFRRIAHSRGSMSLRIKVAG